MLVIDKTLKVIEKTACIGQKLPVIKERKVFDKKNEFIEKTTSYA